jgi:hypothetical protein
MPGLPQVYAELLRSILAHFFDYSQQKQPLENLGRHDVGKFLERFQLCVMNKGPCIYRALFVFRVYQDLLVLEHAPADHDLLHFGSAFIDLRDLGIAHQTFYVEFLHIAVAAVDLYRLVGYPLSDF